MKRGGDVDRAIEWIAARNNRVVTWAALQAAGIGNRAVEHRVAIGRLYRRHTGVYLLEPPGRADRLTLLTAAVAACGPGALLSHRSAAELWGMRPPHPGDIDVMVIGRNPGVRPGIRRHRIAALDSTDVRSRRGIKVTSPARTIIDNAGDPDLEELVAAAIAAGRVRPRQIEQAIARYPTCPGVARLSAILRQDGGPRLTRSWGERRILALIRKAGLPVPETNVPLHGYNVDALWRDLRLVVEVDGYESHGDRAAFEADRARDATHVAAGYRVIRFTAVQLRDEPLVVIARLAAALAAAAREAAA